MVTNVAYKTIYDIQEAGCRYGFISMLLGLLVIYSAVEWYRGKRWAEKMQAGYSPKTFCLFFGVLTVLAFVATWGDYFSLTNAVKNGQATTIDGVVSDFHPAENIKSTEYFAVGERVFAYSKYAVKQGFNMLKLEGSPLADGLHVRVSYIDDHIVKLEIIG